MKVSDLMTHEPTTCAPTDLASVAARLMWEGDCGVIPVVDTRERLLGMVTDRDLCMAAFIRDVRLAELTVASVMSRIAVTCGPDDSIADAERRMARAQVRRLAVVDADGRLRGVLSISDIVRAHGRTGQLEHEELLGTLAAIGSRRSTREPNGNPRV